MPRLEGVEEFARARGTIWFILFKQLATLRRDAPLFDDVEQLLWRGMTPGFAVWTERLGAPRMLERCRAAAARATLNKYTNRHIDAL